MLGGMFMQQLSSIYSENTVDSPIMNIVNAKYLYDSHGVFYEKSSLKYATPPKILYPFRMSVNLHDFKPSNTKTSIVTCKHCGMTFDKRSKSNVEYHNIMHLKLANFINTNCIYESMDSSKAAIDMGCKFFDMCDDYETLMQAAHMILLGYFSRYVISNFWCRTTPKLSKNAYFSEFIAANPEKFPKEIYYDLVKMWVNNDSSFNKEKYALGFDPDDPLDPIRRREQRNA